MRQFAQLTLMIEGKSMCAFFGLRINVLILKFSLPFSLTSSLSETDKHSPLALQSQKLAQKKKYHLSQMLIYYPFLQDNW